MERCNVCGMFASYVSNNRYYCNLHEHRADLMNEIHIEYDDDVAIEHQEVDLTFTEKYLHMYIVLHIIWYYNELTSVSYIWTSAAALMLIPTIYKIIKYISNDIKQLLMLIAALKYELVVNIRYIVGHMCIMATLMCYAVYAILYSIGLIIRSAIVFIYVISYDFAANTCKRAHKYRYLIGMFILYLLLVSAIFSLPGPIFDQYANIFIISILIPLYFFLIIIVFIIQP